MKDAPIGEYLLAKCLNCVLVTKAFNKVIQLIYTCYAGSCHHHIAAANSSSVHPVHHQLI